MEERGTQAHQKKEWSGVERMHMSWISEGEREGKERRRRSGGGGEREGGVRMYNARYDDRYAWTRRNDYLWVERWKE